jgi:hypothetical protein
MSISVIGLIITFSIFLSHVIYKTGHISARVEELEKWRGSIRDDMHEISDRLQIMNETLKQLSVLIDERTERRNR